MSKDGYSYHAGELQYRIRCLDAEVRRWQPHSPFWRRVYLFHVHRIRLHQQRLMGFDTGQTAVLKWKVKGEEVSNVGRAK